MRREGGLPSEEAEPEGFVLGVRRWGERGGFTFRGSRARGVCSGSEKMRREGGLPSEEAEPEGFVLRGEVRVGGGEHPSEQLRDGHALLLVAALRWETTDVFARRIRASRVSSLESLNARVRVESRVAGRDVKPSRKSIIYYNEPSSGRRCSTHVGTVFY